MSAVALSLLALSISQSTEPIDLALAMRYFQEAQWASDDDGGKLWGKALIGPLIFIDPKSRAIVASQADKEGRLSARQGVFVGQAPQEMNAANSATDWAGVRWTTLVWPLPNSHQERARLYMHECFHRLQPELGLPANNPGNTHLDTKDGRVWLLLEWKALERALTTMAAERRQAIADALLFRAHRRSLFPASAALEEDALEINEGLSEYTGVRLMGLDQYARRFYMLGRLRVNVLKPSYTRSFAYETGPAYGLLLDQESETWRQGLTPSSSLSGLLAQLREFQPPTELADAALGRALEYGGREIMLREETRETSRLAQIAEYRRLLVEGPVLELPLRQIQFSFDPNQVFPLGEDGTVYPTMRLTDEWGVLEVEKGARINGTFNAAFVSAPSTGTSGDGWTLTLNAGWKLVAGKRKGDLTVAKAPSAS